MQRILPHYRVAFFERLDQALRGRGIALAVFYGQERPGSVPITAAVEAPWARRIDNRYVPFAGGDLVLQRCPPLLGQYDLVIVEQALRLPLATALVIGSRWSRTAVAYWGHGRNFQARGRSPAEWLKRRMIALPDWWFAYTARTAGFVAAAGFPEDRITVVDNTIDTEALRTSLQAVTPEDLQRVRVQHDLAGDQIALYCGGMVAEKRIAFLIESARAVRAAVPGFELVMIGDGPEQWRVERAAREHRWIKYLGPLFGGARAPYFRLARVMVMPGAVGLAVVDALAAGVPLVTTDIEIHSPEIAYLVNGVNGLVARDTIGDYAAAVTRGLTDARLHATLVEGCGESASTLTMDRMVANFRDGVLASLGSRRGVP